MTTLGTGGDVGDELVRLASADNFRDVAGPGHATTAGGRVATGLFFRSNQLQLSTGDAAALAGLGIGGVFDLRDAYEVEAHPDVEIPGASWEHLQVRGIPSGAATELADPEQAAATMHAIYRRFVTDPDARESFGTLLQRLAVAQTPQLFHCTAGKDRTGWATALLLHVAGVDRAVVLEDYLLTNTVSRGTHQRYLDLVAEHLGADRIPIFERVMVADESYLQAAYDIAESHFGSLDGYLTGGLGLDAATLVVLRARLVTAA